MITGVKYPFEIENGNLKVVKDDDWAQSAIRHYLDTYPLENPMRSSYGFNPGLFDTRTSTTFINLKDRLQAAIPDVDIEVVSDLESLNIFYSYRGSEDTKLYVYRWT
jgi:hypothetical protein